MRNPLVRAIDATTMYRLVLYALGAVAAVGVVLDVERVLSLAVLAVVAFASNRAFARMVGASPNAESSLITALILFLILSPAYTAADFLALAFAALLASASKYLVAVRGRHLFNPAAFAAVTMGLLGWAGASWWVGSAALLPVVAAAGLAVAYKTRRLPLVATFCVAAIASILISARTLGLELSLADAALQGMRSWPILFFGLFMLTEPLTLPASRPWQFAEAAFIGLLFAFPLSLGPFRSSPELILLVGNLFALADGIKRTYRMRLVERTEVVPGVYDLAFSSDVPLRFRPGQYLEWTLPHANPDRRGTRRTFTVASAPTSDVTRLAIRVPDRPSSFKRALLALRPGDRIAGSNLAGDFTLPRDPCVPLAFVAGGIGVTPFRSMAEDLIARGEKRDIVLFYCVRSASDLAFVELFERASEIGLRLVPVPADTLGPLTPDLIRQHAPDFAARTFYLSGPNPMVVAYKKTLRGMGLSAARTRTDYFPGY